MSTLVYAAVFLTAAAIAAPLAKRIGLGAILGYLAAGVVIGPSGFGVFYGLHAVEEVMHVAEFGVVLLLFLIGLELRPKRLWSMRTSIFGMGAVQMIATALIIGAAGLMLGVTPATAILIGLTLALSSTAFALQSLAERGQMASRHGRAAFAILLFQDMAVIPILAVLPLLAGGAEQGAIDPLAALRAFAVIAAVVVIGRYVLRYVYKLIASVGVREALTASALLTVVGVALLMEFAGLSAGLGAFLAGLLLADSEYRHQLEAEIAPFESLLLGIFFVAVGMSLDLGLVVSKPLVILALTLGLLAIKAAVLFGLGLFNRLGTRQALLLAVAIPQGGEFAFVILTQAAGSGVIEPALADLLSVVVTLSMAATPLLLLLVPTAPAQAGPERDFDDMPSDEPPVIIAGFGRFGQIVARVLRAKGIRFTALDKSVAQVDFVKRFGNKIFYGDATMLDLLRSAGAAEANVFVLAIDDVEDSLKTARMVRRAFPDLKIYARARDRQHAHRLIDLGVDVIRRETFLAALDMTREVLEGLGVSAKAARDATETFRQHDRKRLYDDYQIASDEEKLRERALRANEELEGLFQRDATEAATAEASVKHRA
ncbi:MAG: monovalent cation:proton antiporter-2 (CPA2) family protein [Geminicoccaceae bacterium]